MMLLCLAISGYDFYTKGYHRRFFMKYIILLLMFSVTLFAAPQAVVFDFGGVMTKEPNREAVVAFLCASLKLSAAEFEEANAQKKAALKAGKTDEAFWLAFAKQKGIKLSEKWSDEFDRVLQQSMGINPEMYQLVDQLKQSKVRVAMLSNIDERLAAFLRKWKLYEPFDPCLLSYEIGIEKPDPKAFELLLKRLNLPASDVVFIDDKVENVEAARRLGIHAILFESSEQIRQELAKKELLPAAR